MAKPKPKPRRTRPTKAPPPSPRSMVELLEAARRVQAKCRETIHQLAAMQEQIRIARERDEERYIV
jgi:hypothetical protein